MKKLSHLWLIIALTVTCQSHITHTFCWSRLSQPFRTTTQKMSGYFKPKFRQVKRFFGFKDKPLMDINKRYKTVKTMWFGASIKAYFLQYCLWTMYCDNKEAMTNKAAEHALNGSYKRYTYPFVTSQALAQAIVKMNPQKLAKLWQESPVSRKTIEWAFTMQIKNNLCREKINQSSNFEQSFISLD